MSFWRLLLKSLTYVHLLEKMRLVRFIIYLSLLCVEPVISQEINFTHSVQHSFIENKGQWKDHVLFQSKINNTAVAGQRYIGLGTRIIGFITANAA